MSTISPMRTRASMNKKSKAENWAVSSTEKKSKEVVSASLTDDSDDEAPEAVSLATSRQQVKTAARQAQTAIDEKAAELRKKRRDVDTRLKSQRKERDERVQKVTVNQRALPADLLENIAQLDEEKEQQQQALQSDAQKQHGAHRQFNSEDEDEDEEMDGYSLALPGGISQSANHQMDWARGTRRSQGDIGRQKRARDDGILISKAGIQVTVLKQTPKLSKPIDSSAVKFKKRVLHGKRVARGDALRHGTFRKLAIPLQFKRQ
ncbi:hypothetical protein BDF19DRAFT_431275 [Syncephalis fuscata]|nr:hypothetical protein BDF19DRAFT_431275 [Syncephalis fuscata]